MMKGFSVFDGIAPFRPLHGGEGQIRIQHGGEHIHKGYVGSDGTKQLRSLIDDRSHQFTACAAATNGNLAGLRMAAGNQVSGTVDEVVKGIGSLRQLA